MAGQTDNTTFLQAANETIQAINDAAPDLDDLTGAVVAADAGPHIDTLASQLNANMQALTNAANCLCSAVQGLAANQIVERTLPLPDPYNPPQPGPAPDPSDPPPDTHPDWDSYLCGAGAVLCDSIANTAEELRAWNGSPLWNMLALVGVIASMLVFAFGGGLALIVSTGLVIQLWAALGEFGEATLDEVLENIAYQMRNNNTLRGCVSAAMRDGDGVSVKVDMVKQAIALRFEGLGANIATLMVFPEAVEVLAYGRDDGAAAVEYAATPVGVGCDCWEDISLWRLSYTTGKCGATTYNPRWNYYDRLSFEDFRLSKDSSTGPYTLSATRDCQTVGAGANVSVNLQGAGHMVNWALLFYNRGTHVQTNSIGVGTSSFLVSSAFDKVVLRRNGESYYASCPRMFDVDVRIEVDDPAWLAPIS